MRISDWSSDVCSSDLMHEHEPRLIRSAREMLVHRDVFEHDRLRLVDPHPIIEHIARIVHHRRHPERVGNADERHREIGGQAARRLALAPRSEEHTSELQSLMTISYAVFRFDKKLTTQKH